MTFIADLVEFKVWERRKLKRIIGGVPKVEEMGSSRKILIKKSDKIEVFG